jgi:hypothetical protein
MVTDDEPHALLLRTVIRQLTETADPDGALSPLAEYAEALERDGQRALAADIYAAIFRCGVVTRLLPPAPHVRPERASIRSGAPGVQLKGEPVEGRLDLLDADALAAADAAARASLVEATHLGAPEIKARAALLCARIAHRRLEYDDAVMFAWRAVMPDATTRDPTWDNADPTALRSVRDAAMLDLGTNLLEIGDLLPARDAFELAGACAADSTVRAAAAIALLEIAVLEQAEPVFARLCHQLDALTLPPRLATEFALHRGRGYLAFGRSAPARAALLEAQGLAERHGLSELVALAADALDDADVAPGAAQTQPSSSGAAPARSPMVRGVAILLRDMREMLDERRATPPSMRADGPSHVPAAKVYAALVRWVETFALERPGLHPADPIHVATARIMHSRRWGSCVQPPIGTGRWPPSCARVMRRPRRAGDVCEPEIFGGPCMSTRPPRVPIARRAAMLDGHQTVACGSPPLVAP